MDDYDVVLAATVRQWLLEREWEERESLLKAIWEELGVADGRSVSLPLGYTRRELAGYLIDYRQLGEEEAERFGVRAGHLIAWIAEVPGVPVESLGRDPYELREVLAPGFAGRPPGPPFTPPPPPGPVFTPRPPGPRLIPRPPGAGPIPPEPPKPRGER